MSVCDRCHRYRTLTLTALIRGYLNWTRSVLLMILDLKQYMCVLCTDAYIEYLSTIKLCLRHFNIDGLPKKKRQHLHTSWFFCSYETFQVSVAVDSLGYLKKKKKTLNLTSFARPKLHNPTTHIFNKSAFPPLLNYFYRICQLENS